jgi:hypothetical protein
MLPGAASAAARAGAGPAVSPATRSSFSITVSAAATEAIDNATSATRPADAMLAHPASPIRALRGETDPEVPYPLKRDQRTLERKGRQARKASEHLDLACALCALRSNRLEMLHSFVVDKPLGACQDAHRDEREVVSHECLDVAARPRLPRIRHANTAARAGSRPSPSENATAISQVAADDADSVVRGKKNASTGAPGRSPGSPEYRRCPRDGVAEMRPSTAQLGWSSIGGTSTSVPTAARPPDEQTLRGVTTPIGRSAATGMLPGQHHQVTA